MTDQVAKLAPHIKPLKSVEELFKELNERLKDEFCLDPLPLYVIVTEGWTDVNYLRFAADLALRETGVDLLSARVGNETVSIGIVTPGNRGNPRRGGVKQVVRLAEAVHSACFSYGAYYGVAFLLDHDGAGMTARDELVSRGFPLGKHTLTLDPKAHPTACAQKQVVIEDLLSIQIQTSFFNQGASWCSAQYEAGVLRRFIWEHQSKDALQDFVLNHGKWQDILELVRVLVRVREMWGLPVDPALFTPRPQSGDADNQHPGPTGAVVSAGTDVAALPIPSKASEQPQDSGRGTDTSKGV